MHLLRFAAGQPLVGMAKVHVTPACIRLGGNARIESHRIHQRPMLARTVKRDGLVAMLQRPRDLAPHERQFAHEGMRVEEVKYLSRAVGGYQGLLRHLDCSREFPFHVVRNQLEDTVPPGSEQSRSKCETRDLCKGQAT